jgi:anti-anti-sigma factor
MPTDDVRARLFVAARERPPGQTEGAPDVPTVQDKTPQFGVVTEAVGDSVRVVAVAGELDISSVSGLRDALQAVTDQGVSGLVVDLAEATFVDSVAVGTILQAKRRLPEDGRVAIVIPERTYAALIFDVVGADAIVDVFRTRADALAHVVA